MSFTPLLLRLQTKPQPQSSNHSALCGRPTDTEGTEQSKLEIAKSHPHLGLYQKTKLTKTASKSPHEPQCNSAVIQLAAQKRDKNSLILSKTISYHGVIRLPHEWHDWKSHDIQQVTAGRVVCCSIWWRIRSSYSSH